MARRRTAGLLVSALVSAAVLLLLMRGIPWGDLAASVARASRPALGAYAAIALAGIWFRALRFRILLPPPRPGHAPVLLATAVQNCLGDLVPGRLASFGSWVWLLVRRLGVPPEPAAATFLVSFVLDFATLGPLLALAALMLAGGGPALPGGGALPLGWVVALGAALFAASALALVFLGPLAALAARLLDRGDAGAHPRRSAAAARLGALAAALAGARRAGALGPAFLYSLAVRLAKYASLFALMTALLDGAGVSGPRPDVWDLVVAVSATEIVASLPLPALGQFGVWEGGLVGSLVLLGFARAPATIAAIGIHAVTQAFEYAVGLAALGAIAALRRGGDAPEAPPGGP